MRKENVSRENVENAMKYDKDFQPSSEQTYKINNNEGGGKKIRSVFVKYFEWGYLSSTIEQKLGHRLI